MGKDKLINGVNRCNLSGSYKTQYNHRLEATRFVEQLRKNGYGVQRWQNVTNKHVASVVNSWKEQGLSNKTIKEYLSGVRAIASAYGNEFQFLIGKVKTCLEFGLETVGYSFNSS